MTYNELSGLILDVAIDIHRRLGPGLLESVYQVVLAHELTKRGCVVEKEEPIPLMWDNIRFEVGFRADLIVNDLILVELKSLEQLAPVHKASPDLSACHRKEARPTHQFRRGSLEERNSPDH